MSTSRGDVIRFFAATGGWTATLAAAWVVTVMITNGGPHFLGHEILQLVAMSLVFSSFAGGISAVRPNDGPPWSRYRAALAAAAIVGVAAWWMVAYAAPAVEFRMGSFDAGEVGIRAEARTPTALRALRETVATTPPAAPRPSAENPELWAASWVDYTLIRPRVAGLLAPLSAVLGMMAAILTLGLRPGRRRRVRWALGLGAVAIYYASDAFVSSSLVTHPSGSGVLRSWAVLVPLLCLATAGWGMIWARTRGR